MQTLELHDVKLHMHSWHAHQHALAFFAALQSQVQILKHCIMSCHRHSTASAQLHFILVEYDRLSPCLLQVFSTVDPSLSVTWTAKDGDHVTSGTKFGTVKGSARSILIAERIALNFTQRMSGIATATAAMVEQMKAGACTC